MPKKSKEELLDRDVEIREITSIINANSSSKIILLHGISGIGKSGLIEKLKYSSDLPYIITAKITKNSISTIENLQYFNSIYKALYKFSINNYSYISTPTERGLMSLSNWIKNIIAVFKNKLGFDNVVIAEPTEDDSIIRKKDYILYVLKQSNVILDIENIQNIDTQSFEILLDIITSVTNRTFILEYTTTDNSRDHYINMYKELLETGCEINEYAVIKMDFDYAKQLTPANKKIDLDLLKKKYDNSHGNLMEVILANENVESEKNNIALMLSTLDKNEFYILFIIFLYNSCIEYHELFQIIAGSDSILMEITYIDDISNLSTIINKLEYLKLIKYENDLIKLKHDSIIDEIAKIDKDNPVLYCSYSTVKSHLLNKLKTDPYDSKTLEISLNILLMFSDPELITILPNIKHLIISIKYPELIIKKLSEYQKAITLNYHYNIGIYKLTIMLVEICLAHKLYNQAQNHLDSIFDIKNIYHIALQGEIYALQESYDAGYKINTLKSHTKADTRIRLILDLCELYFSMKINPTKTSRHLAENILNNSSYKKYYEYAYALRNYAELLENNNECIDYYLKALHIFKQRNMRFEEATVYISLSMIYSYEGNLQIARKYLQKAQNINNVSQCYILNNRSAIDILEGEFNHQTEKALKDASLLSVTKYEKIIIDCNLLILYCLLGKIDQAEKYAKRIEISNYQYFNYEELLHIVYQDLYYYYKTINDDEQTAYYYQRILGIINDKQTRMSTKNLAKAMNGLKERDSYYTQFDYRVDFLGYWEFTVDNDLDHF